MTAHALYVTGEWLCVLSVILFCCAALDALKHRQPRRERR